MSSPSISVMNCGRAFSLASTLRQSYSVPQKLASFCIVASCTPCDESATVSRSGHCVAAMRRRRLARASSATLMRKGRMSGWVIPGGGVMMGSGVMPGWVICGDLHVLYSYRFFRFLLRRHRGQATLLSMCHHVTRQRKGWVFDVGHSVMGLCGLPGHASTSHC